MPAPIALFLVGGLAALALAKRSHSSSSSSGWSSGGYGPPDPTPYSNGMAADANTPNDTRAMVEAILTSAPTNAEEYHGIVGPLVNAAAMLRQNYPRAANALWQRYTELRAMALAEGWRELDALDQAGQP